jgi:hypothetical protein
VRVAVLAVVALLAAGAVDAALDVDLKTYAEARRRGEIVTIEGRVYNERRKPNADDVPMPHAVVFVLPRSEALVRRLDELRARARESMSGFRDAATQMRRARESYEREVWQAGAPDLVQSTMVDAGGRFVISDLPAGRYLVWVTNSDFVDSKAKVPDRDRGRYRLPPRLVGYYAERAWLREIETAPGSVTTLELNDRNVWFSGVVEDRVLDAGSRYEPAPRP